MPKTSEAKQVLYSGNQVVVKLKEETAREVAPDISWRPLRFVSEPATSLGVSAMDKMSRDLGVEAIRRVARPTLAFAEEGFVKEEPDPFGLHRTYVLRLAEGADVVRAAATLAKHPGVEAAEPNYLATTCIVPNDPQYAQQWGLPRINCPAGWDRTTGCPSVIVATVDTGVDLAHPDLLANLVPGYDFVDLGAAPAGWHWEGDFVGRDPTPDDDLGHGTHVAGTIAARTNNAIGVAGVTWTCKIMPLRALAKLVNNTTGTIQGSGSYADIADAIKWAADKGAHVVNMSLGGPASFVLQAAIDYAFAKNCVLVAAMGNDGSNVPSYPAAYPNVLAVGATDKTDTRAAFSNFGPHIDVVAPGVSILSTVPPGAYGTKSGTSMATPHVAGLAALLKCCNANFSNTQIMDIIRKTARPLGSPVPNDQYGYGIIDVAKALGQCPPRIVFDPCRIWPWFPGCRPWDDICRRFPWLCHGLPGWPPIPKPPPIGPPIGGLEQRETTPNGEDPMAALLEMEKELKQALRAIRRIRRGEDPSGAGSAGEGGCPCDEEG